MISVDIIDQDSLDLDEYVSLQCKSYADLLQESQVSGTFISRDYYKWKYSTPSSFARIAIVRDNGSIVSANAMFPVNIFMEDFILTGWQSCDTATHPDYRGRGFFYCV